MFPLLALLATQLAPAEAGVLEPQVRVHAGVNYVMGPSPFGLTAGLDARLTRILAIDLGGFGSVAGIEESDYRDQDVETDYYRLRHGVYFAPGLRIPHPQPRTWSWDIFFRGGAGVIWYTDTQPEAITENSGAGSTTAAAGGFGGLDLMVRFGSFGVRASGRGWVYEAQHSFGGTPSGLIQPQLSLEGLVEF